LKVTLLKLFIMPSFFAIAGWGQPGATPAVKTKEQRQVQISGVESFGIGGEVAKCSWP
jgi:hypothetical protein